MQSKHKSLWLIPFVFIVVVMVWFFTRDYPPKIKLSSAEEKHMNELLSDMRTHCVGRYLIDLPASFTLSTGTEPLEEEQWVADINWPDRSYKAYIASKRMYYPAFEQLLKRREKELSETRTANPVNMPFLKKIWPLPAGMKGIIFERNLDTSADDALRTLEAYVHSNDVAIKIQKKSANDLSPRYKKDRERRGSETNYIPGDIDKINDLLSRIRGRESGEVPREPGSCIANAFIAIDKSGREQEDITLLFSSKKLPGVNIEVSTNNFLQSDDSLLDRAGEISDAYSRVNASILAKGSRKINSLKAEEMIASGPKPGSNNPIYIFSLYVNEMQGSNRTPWLNFNLSNESNAIIPYTGYTQDELIMFWNAITQTIRMRPGAN